MTNDLKLKLDPQALRVLKNLTKALDGVAKALQVNNPRKPKNSELRLTEPAILEEGDNLPGEMTDEEFAEATRIYESRYGEN